MEDTPRRFPGRRTVRLGDVTGSGRMRLDAVARYLQDVATDDAADAGLADGWVLRRVELHLDGFPRFREPVDLVTWCTGVAASAAERRTTLAVGGRVLVAAVALWVFVGPDGRPARLDKGRFGALGIPTDRRIGTRLHHEGYPDPQSPAATTVEWPLRAADVDVLRHVNNAVTLAAVEDVLRAEGVADAAPPWSVEVEYRAAIDPDERPQLTWARGPDGAVVGGLHCTGSPRATFRWAVPGKASSRT